MSATDYMNKVKSTMSKEQQSQDKNAAAKPKNNFGINVFSYFKILFVLAIIIAVIYFIAQFLKKYLYKTGVPGQGVDVVLSQSLGVGKWIQVVHVAGRYLILGVTNDNISLLSEVNDKAEIERYEIIMNEKKTEIGETFVDTVTGFLKDKFKKFKKDKFDYEKDTMEFLNNQKERLNKLNKKDEE
jgi:flagellar protein FliO/FliZ